MDLQVQAESIVPFNLAKGMVTTSNGFGIIGQAQFLVKNWLPSKHSPVAKPVIRVSLSLDANTTAKRIFAFTHSVTNGLYFLVVGSNGRCYRIRASDWNVTYLSNLLSDKPFVGAAAINHHNFLCNATDLIRHSPYMLQVLFGSLRKPTTAPTAAGGAAGNLKGTYQWRVTFVSYADSASGTGELESEPSDPTPPLTLNNQQANLTIPTEPEGRFGVAKRRIYRYGGTVNEWVLVGEINDNTTTAFVDNNSDATIIGNKSLDLTAAAMPYTGNNFGAIAVWQNRLWLAQGTKVYFSEVFNPAIYHLTTDAEWKGGWVELNTAGGNQITGLVPLSQGLLIFLENEVWLLAGTSPENFVLTQLSANIGARQPYHIAQSGDIVVWWRQDPVSGRLDVFRFDGSSISNLSNDINNVLSYLKSLGATETADRIAVNQVGEIVILLRRPDLTGDPNDSESGLGGQWSLSALRPLQFLLFDPASQSWVLCGFPQMNVADVVGWENKFYLLTSSGKIWEWQPMSGEDPAGVLFYSGKWLSPDGFKWILTGFSLGGQVPQTTELLVIADGQATKFTIPTGYQSLYYPTMTNFVVGRQMEFVLKSFNNNRGVNPQVVLTCFLTRGGL